MEEDQDGVGEHEDVFPDVDVAFTGVENIEDVLEGEEDVDMDSTGVENIEDALEGEENVDPVSFGVEKFKNVLKADAHQVLFGIKELKDVSE